jgi:hypothetical protein
MEVPAQKKRKIVVIAKCNNKVLVVKSALWHYPDTHEDWEIGKRLASPQVLANKLLRNVSCGIIHLKNFTREKIPSGGYLFLTEIENLEELVDIFNRVHKHLKLDIPNLALVSLEEILEINSFARFHGHTIECSRLIK